MRLIYLIGGPGAGKSTLMARLTAGSDRLTVEKPVPHDRLIDRVTGDSDAVEIGRRRAAFSGTDALASAIIDKAVPWIASRPAGLVLGEGARLGNARFLTAAALAGYDITLTLLDHPQVDAWRLARSARMGRDQSPSWAAGRVTASRNLAANPPAGTTVLRGHPDDLEPALRELMA